jgi:hypothetical protein
VQARSPQEIEKLVTFGTPEQIATAIRDAEHLGVIKAMRIVGGAVTVGEAQRRIKALADDIASRA